MLQGIFLLSPLSNADSGLMPRHPSPQLWPVWPVSEQDEGTQPTNNKTLENNHLINGICFISMESLKMREQTVRMLALRSADSTELSQARTHSGTAEFKMANDTIKTVLFHLPVLLFFVSWLHFFLSSCHGGDSFISSYTKVAAESLRFSIYCVTKEVLSHRGSLQRANRK